MKIILNQDVANLGELGDVREVAAGYARNYLLPRKFALPFTSKNVALFEKRKSEIESHKEEKRKASSGLKEKLEALEITILVPAGENGKLYGAVTSATLVDELLKHGIEIERKRLDIHERVIKSAGKYTVTARLYEKEEASIKIVVQGQQSVRKESAEPRPTRRSRHEERAEEAQTAPADAATADTPAPEAQA